MKTKGIDPSLPPIGEEILFLFEWLMDIGPVESGAAGAVAISWQTLYAWCDRTGIDLQPWQSRLLRRLSGDWLKESDSARETNAAPPWTDRPSEAVRKSIETRLEAFFDGLG